MNSNDLDDRYDSLHATVVDAIRYAADVQSHEDAAHEALHRLREHRLDIPPRSAQQ